MWTQVTDTARRQESSPPCLGTQLLIKTGSASTFPRTPRDSTSSSVEVYAFGTTPGAVPWSHSAGSLHYDFDSLFSPTSAMSSTSDLSTSGVITHVRTAPSSRTRTSPRTQPAALTPPASPRATRPVPPPRPLSTMRPVAPPRPAATTANRLFLDPPSSLYSERPYRSEYERRSSVGYASTDDSTFSAPDLPDGSVADTLLSIMDESFMDQPVHPEPTSLDRDLIIRAQSPTAASRTRSVSNVHHDPVNSQGLPMAPVLKRSTSHETIGPTLSSVAAADSPDPELTRQSSNIRRANARESAVRELLDTERKYLDNLNVVLEVFYLPLRSILNRSEMTTLFCNLEALMTCSAQLVSILEAQLEEEFTTGSPMLIGEIFMSLAGAFDCYAEYNANHSKATKLLTTKPQVDERMARVLATAAENPRCGRLPLFSFLLQPIQRISRYPLLLKNILHYTGPDHPDHFQLRLAADMMCGVTEKANELTRYREDLDKCREMADTIDFTAAPDAANYVWDPTAEHPLLGKRHFVIEGTVTKWRGGRKLNFHLFNDVILLVKAQRSALSRGKKELYRKPWSTNEIMVRPVEPKPFMTEPACFFELVHVNSGETLLLEAPDRSLARKWMADISATCQVHYRLEAQAKRKLRQSVIGRRSTLRRRTSSAAKGSRSPPLSASRASIRATDPAGPNRTSVHYVTTTTPTCITTKVVAKDGGLPLASAASRPTMASTVSASSRSSLLGLPTWTVRGRARTQTAPAATTASTKERNRRSVIMSFFDLRTSTEGTVEGGDPMGRAATTPSSATTATASLAPTGAARPRPLSAVSMASELNDDSFVSATSHQDWLPDIPSGTLLTTNEAHLDESKAAEDSLISPPTASPGCKEGDSDDATDYEDMARHLRHHSAPEFHTDVGDGVSYRIPPRIDSLPADGEIIPPRRSSESTLQVVRQQAGQRRHRHLSLQSTTSTRTVDSPAPQRSPQRVNGPPALCMRPQRPAVSCEEMVTAVASPAVVAASSPAMGQALRINTRLEEYHVGRPANTSTATSLPRMGRAPTTTSSSTVRKYNQLLLAAAQTRGTLRVVVLEAEGLMSLDPSKQRSDDTNSDKSVPTSPATTGPRTMSTASFGEHEHDSHPTISHLNPYCVVYLRTGGRLEPGSEPSAAVVQSASASGSSDPARKGSGWFPYTRFSSFISGGSGLRSADEASCQTLPGPGTSPATTRPVVTITPSRDEVEAARELQLQQTRVVYHTRHPHWQESMVFCLTHESNPHFEQHKATNRARLDAVYHPNRPQERTGTSRLRKDLAPSDSSPTITDPTSTLLPKEGHGSGGRFSRARAGLGRNTRWFGTDAPASATNERLARVSATPTLAIKIMSEDPQNDTDEYLGMAELELSSALLDALKDADTTSTGCDGHPGVIKLRLKDAPRGSVVVRLSYHPWY
ncbi:hypothetical protein IWQ60_009279 [Tieghemiomyces parasiticus]|uniref:DH domain-containing protein n=1 Tax=Tieghemiomyces parasiticus TaxID=78921 RepID=A0A9W7ZNK7_9FUNG|nr:hypothetical protein IWQ60_009279 [Tieghemiomyces parasiticus]